MTPIPTSKVSTYLTEQIHEFTAWLRRHHPESIGIEEAQKLFFMFKVFHYGRQYRCPVCGVRNKPSDTDEVGTKIRCWGCASRLERYFDSKDRSTTTNQWRTE